MNSHFICWSVSWTVCRSVIIFWEDMQVWHPCFCRSTCFRMKKSPVDPLKANHVDRLAEIIEGSHPTRSWHILTLIDTIIYYGFRQCVVGGGGGGGGRVTSKIIYIKTTKIRPSICVKKKCKIGFECLRTRRERPLTMLLFARWAPKAPWSTC